MKRRKYWTAIAALVLFGAFVQPSAAQDSVEQDRGVLSIRPSKWSSLPPSTAMAPRP